MTLSYLQTSAFVSARVELIQSLWSGYGAIKRYSFEDKFVDEMGATSVIVKHVQVPNDIAHPRGWHSNLSHQRKIRSYQVESCWYRNFSPLCKPEYCRVAKSIYLEAKGNEFLMVLEDLDAVGFSRRYDSLSPEKMTSCLRWLANFHAIFLGCSPFSSNDQSLWPIGTYWHLATRPDELAALDDLALQQAAKIIDQRLAECRYQTLVHGDAKLANFCFADDGESVAAVDFQYVGGGCGMKDVAYFIGSCLKEQDCEACESFLLDTYFSELKQAVQIFNKSIDLNELEAEWRFLFPYAWADFHRFLKGWSPGHWKINAYSEKQCRQVLLDCKL